MLTTLKALGDRLGHTVLLVLVGAAAASAAPGDYTARRFDVVAKAAYGGLDVTESITFEFQSGTFTFVWREIPAERTDGIDIIEASMDGRSLAPGKEPGQFSVRGSDHVRVEWHFAETGASVHRFDLHYFARGVAYRDAGEDVLRWRALPSEHRYRIDASRIQFIPGASHVVEPVRHRVSSATLQTSSESVTIDVAGIQSNGWIVAELRYPGTTLIAADPEWRAHEMRARALGSRWGIGGAAVLAIALMLILFGRHGYLPPESFPVEMPATEPPASLPAALAAALTQRGRVGGYQSIGTILDLADRGVLTIAERPASFGRRSYELSQVPGSHDLEPHEEEAVRIAFADRAESVPLARARARLARGARRFGTAVSLELLERGLLDPDRRTTRTRVSVIAILMLPASVIGGAAVAPLIPRYGLWPLLMPLGLLLAGVIGVLVAASLTPLSDEGLLEAAQWRGFKRYLRTLASNGEDGGDTVVPSRFVVYAMSFGLGAYWSRYLKRHPGAVPVWFTSDGTDPGGAFAAFVGSHSASGAGSGAGGATAGGGGSGAG